MCSVTMHETIRTLKCAANIISCTTRHIISSYTAKVNMDVVVNNDARPHTRKTRKSQDFPKNQAHPAAWWELVGPLPPSLSPFP